MNPKTKRRIMIGVITLAVILIGVFFAQKYGLLQSFLVYSCSLPGYRYCTQATNGTFTEKMGWNIGFVQGDYNTALTEINISCQPNNVLYVRGLLPGPTPFPYLADVWDPPCYSGLVCGVPYVWITSVQATFSGYIPSQNHHQLQFNPSFFDSRGWTNGFWTNFVCYAIEPGTQTSVFTTSGPVWVPNPIVTYVCGNGIREGTELCDGGSQSCTLNGYSGTQSCNSQCNGYNACTTTQSCGDNIKNGPEVCDGTALGGNSCTTFGYTGGTLSCNSACSGFVKTACTSPPVQTCGNNIIEGTELCDGGSQSCTLNGYSGTQSCNSQCNGYNACTTTQSCGDNIKNGPEVCDGTAIGTQTCPAGTTGSVSCNSACSGYITSNCIATTQTQSNQLTTINTTTTQNQTNQSTTTTSVPTPTSTTPSTSSSQPSTLSNPTTQLAPLAAVPFVSKEVPTSLILLLIAGAVLLIFLYMKNDRVRIWFRRNKEGMIIGLLIATALMLLSNAYTIPIIGNAINYLKQAYPLAVVWIITELLFAMGGAVVDMLYKPNI